MQLIAKPLELAWRFFHYLFLSFLHTHHNNKQKVYSEITGQIYPETNTSIALHLSFSTLDLSFSTLKSNQTKKFHFPTITEIPLATMNTTKPATDVV